MTLSCFHLSAFVALLMCFAATNGGLDSRHDKKMVTYSTIVVDPSGHGNFSTIRSAIDFIPGNNKQWIHIYVKAGQYREQIKIPVDKPYIYIQGEGAKRTIIIWDGHDTIATSATFMSEADNIVVKGVTFLNSYNLPPEKNRNPVTPALAAMISGDKSAFYGCAFLGFQDTLWDAHGRHYFKYCIIQGAVDFIFGDGQSIYDECTISVAAEALKGSPGYITAQGRSDPFQTSGFVFKNCNVIGNGKAYLGRPWRNHARVVFYSSSMSNIVVPEGWDPWKSVGHENQIVFAEHACRGIGSNTSQRVSWESKLSQEMLDQLINISFVNEGDWISSQPYNTLRS